MQDTRRTIEAFLSLQGTDRGTQPDLTTLIVQMAATTPAIHYIYDLRTHHSIFLNRRIYDALGVVPESTAEMLPDLLHSLMHPEDREKHHLFLQAFDTVTDDAVLPTGYRLRHSNGEWRWLAGKSVVFQRDADGRPIQILTTAEDVTEQKLSDAMLKQSEGRLQLALDNTGLGLWDWDLTTHEIHYNEQWERLLGYTDGELAERIGLTEKMLHSEDVDRVLEALQRHMEDETIPYDIEYRTPHKSGAWVWIHARGKVHSRDIHGNALRMVGTIQDITERKRLEQTLQEDAGRFRTLVDGLPNLIWILDAENRTVLVNRAWSEFTGCPPEEAGDFDWVEAIHPEDRDRVLKQFGEAVAERKPYQAEYRMRDRRGLYRLLLSAAVPHIYHDGTFWGYLGSSLDVTDQKMLQEQLFESQKLESMGRLAGGIAHDFNNLLTAILGYTELSLLSLPQEFEVRPFLNNVSTAAQRAAELTRQLLMYARRQMVEFTTVDMNKVILNIDPLLRRTIGEQYELVTVLTEDACCVHANASQMEQVLTNLVVNARDALPEGGRILIETECVMLDADYAERHIGVTPGEYVMYSVSDQGIGMEAEVRNRIFEPFFTTKEIGRGTGLGLATCYGIVKQSQGNIWVYSEPGKGTTFKIYLPRVPVLEQSGNRKLTENPPEGSEVVLLVDDEPMVRDIAARILRAQGYQVLEASNGAEALHRQSEWPGGIDLLITDVVMPLMGGKELAQRLQDLYPALKVLFMSGYTQNVVLQQGVLKPGVVLLTKPFTPASLFEKVRQALNKAEEE